MLKIVFFFKDYVQKTLTKMQKNYKNRNTNMHKNIINSSKVSASLSKFWPCCVLHIKVK